MVEITSSLAEVRDFKIAENHSTTWFQNYSSDGSNIVLYFKKIICKFVSFNIFGGFWSEIKCGLIPTPLNKNVLVSWKHDVIIDDTALIE